jgi:hypothetical protein
VKTSPVLDTTGEFAHVGQSGSVWFLGGNFITGGRVTRTVTIPSGKGLFFPVLEITWVNIEELGDDPWSPEQRAYARTIIEPFIEDATQLSVEIDGVSVPDLKSYLTSTADDADYMVPMPDGNLFGLPAFTYGPAISVGYYLMLEPLPAGEHTIYISSTVKSDGFVVDNTYYLTVEGADDCDDDGHDHQGHIGHHCSGLNKSCSFARSEGG